MKRIFLFFWLFVAVVPFARADYPAVLQKLYYNSTGVYRTDFAYACVCATQNFSGNTCVLGSNYKSATIDNADPPNCTTVDTSGVSRKYAAQSPIYYCPYGGTLNVTSNAQGVYTRTCVGATLCVAGRVDTVYMDYGYIAPADYANAGKAVALPSSVHGCYVTVNDVITCGIGSTQGTSHYGNAICKFHVTETGEERSTSYVGLDAASLSDTISQSPPPAIKATDSNSRCPLGTSMAGFDSGGTPICVGTGTTPPPSNTTVTQSPTSTVNNADGSSTSTSSVTSINSDGSSTITTTTTTTKSDGSVVTGKVVSTGTTPSGAPGKPDAGTPGAPGAPGAPGKDAQNICQTNPNLTMCNNSSVSGTCGSISCSGDAIQCAALRATAAMQCAQQADSDALKNSASTASGNAILSGTDPQQASIDSTLKGTTTDFSSSATLDQSGFVGSAACLGDKTFTVMGKSVTYSFASLCNNIQPLRYVVMACAFLLVYLMVSRSVING